MPTLRQPVPFSDCTWFGALNPGDQRIVLGALQPRTLQTGQTLFLQGGAPADFYYLKKGALKISSVQENGKEAILALMEAGNWLGASALLDQLPLSHSARAASTCELLVLPRAIFDSLMQSASFARAIAVMLAERVRALCCLIEEATLRSTTARIASRLLSLAQRGANPGSDTPLSARISQDMLAMMLGITRQTVSKQLQAMTVDGVIVLGYGCIEIAAPAALRSIADQV